MQVFRNSKLIQKRVRLASAAHLLALVSFAGGLFLSPEPGNLWLVYGTMVLGLALYSFGQHFLRRWGPRYRYDGIIVQALKGLDKRYAFGTFLDPKLPDYIIVGPHGIIPLVVRPQSGAISCRSDQWSRDAGKWGLVSGLFTPALRNPTADAQRAAEQVRTYMIGRLGSEFMESMPISSTVVFVHPRARLRIDGCSVPVTSSKELRGHLKRGKPAVSAQQIETVANEWKSIAGS